MWFKYGLRSKSTRSSPEAARPEAALKQYALKGQKLLAQGNALGIIAVNKAP